MRKENTFNQGLDENLICRSLEFFATQKIGMTGFKGLIGRSLDACLRKRGMTNKKGCQLGGMTFLFCLLSGVTHAQCVPAPDCGELGYTETSCEGDSLKCPFDISKLYCIPCDSVYQYSCTNAGEIGKGNSCNGKYIECGCADGYEVDGTGCKLSCATTYQYTCSGTGYSSGSGTACGGKYESCTCSTQYKWSGSSCDYCGDSYKYACTVNGNITGGSGTACGNRYTACTCKSPYTWTSGACACTSSYQYTCTGANEDGGLGTACDGKYESCYCATNYTWNGSACVCDSSFQYTCSGSNEIGGSGTACGGKYESCSCSTGYEWKDGACVACDTSCIAGNIRYSDGTCNSCVVSEKMPIGVVVKDNELVLSPSSSMKWSSVRVDTSLDNLTDDQVKNDYSGRSNTATIIAEDSDNIVAKYCNDYTTVGTSSGDWYLPAAGELYSYVYGHYRAIRTTMASIGWTWGSDRLCSSSEKSYDYAWCVYPYNGVMSLGIKDSDNYVSCFLDISGY